MNRERTREVLDKLGIRVEKSDGHGIEIHRWTDAMTCERGRIYTGGGIAGNSDQVWIRPVADVLGVPTLGPYWNKSQLERALRAWRRGE